ncbi:ATP-binding protein [Vibrio diabolicus]|uniref:ATP-binding protein n=1 Tax=Vibrio diabolicus TaxID=50719 RepID=UPI002493F66E|nr:ATP-binding protein [Vibrio diabolicus]
MENDNSIQLIDTIIPNSNKRVTIDLKGKNLIITGGNGCGKTRLLKQIHENISAQVEQMNHKTADQIREDIRNRETWMRNSSPTNSNYHQYKQQLIELELKLAEIDKVKVILGKVENTAPISTKKSTTSFLPCRQRTISCSYWLK